MSATTDEAMDKTVDNITAELRSNVSLNAIITPGEASESDEEEDDYPQPIERQTSAADHGVGRHRKTSEMSQSQRSTVSDDNSSIGDSNKYNSLLHKKLREKNEQLKRELSELASGPYIMATKEVGTITKQLIHSQKMVQNVSASLRKVSKELISLEETIAAIKNDKNLLLTQFSPIDSSVESKESETINATDPQN
ncbi:unnamed protein product [Medioppia subpectinata]|uniref:Biogenesis of lysosome-related organelles complex 1 subunit 3 n=1 Tax=Medioppia subpectinata TaxID=1979941 RepID=A0A7R9KP36_9ACAR|nr:unnamed protein product [Medioppia subpectinata]CAG2106851.1 unnamed protein product [Medioppia subpectinata]